MTTRKKARPVSDVASPPSSDTEKSSFCPMFPDIRVNSVSTVTVQRVWRDEKNVEKRDYVVDDLINAEMDVGDLKSVAGGGEFDIFFYEREHPGRMLTRRHISIEGPPRDYDDETEGDDTEGGTDPIVITGPDGTQTVLPRMKPEALAAYMAQQDRIKSLERQAENGGGGMATMMTGMLQMQMKASENTTAMMIAMMGGGSKNDAAIQALQQQLNQTNAEKLLMMQEHGKTLSEMRAAHAAEVARLRDESMKDRDALRVATSNAETDRKTAVLAAQQRGDLEIKRLTSELNRVESELLKTERDHIRSMASNRSNSDMLEIAKLAIPRLDSLVNRAGNGSQLPPDLRAAIDGIKEILPTVRKLAPLAESMTSEMHNENVENGAATPDPTAYQPPDIQIPVPDMPF